MEQEKVLDCLVIGAGISGITAAIYLSRSSLSFKIVDKSAPGGKLNNIHLIKNYPGFASISGPELALNLLKQLTENKIDVEYAEVRGVNKENDAFIVHTDMGEIKTKALIAATGMNFPGDTIKDEKRYLGKGLSYCATCDGPLYRGEDVIVIGKSSRSIEEAIYLSSICAKVYFVCPGDVKSSELEEYENIEIIVGKPDGIIGENKVEGLMVNGKALSAKAIFPLLGEAPSLSFLSSFDVANEKGFGVVDDDCQSSQSGIYVVGDAVSKRLKQAVGAASDGATAATAVIAFLNKGK